MNSVTYSFSDNFCYHYPYWGWAFLGLLTDGGERQKARVPKICPTYPIMMKLGSYTLAKEDPKNIGIT